MGAVAEILEHVEARALKLRDLQGFYDGVQPHLAGLAQSLLAHPEGRQGGDIVVLARLCLERLTAEQEALVRENQALRAELASLKASREREDEQEVVVVASRLNGLKGA